MSLVRACVILQFTRVPQSPEDLSPGVANTHVYHRSAHAVTLVNSDTLVAHFYPRNAMRKRGYCCCRASVCHESRTKCHWTKCPGQNSTGQNATNSGICFYFLLMFQFVALPLNMSQPMVISAYHKLLFRAYHAHYMSIEHEGK